MKTLLLMRHAKSDWNADYDADHERPLNERGVRSARIMGRVLAAEEEIPSLVVTSTAVRARSTASLANEAGRWDCEIVLDPTLYGGGVDAAIRTASTAPDIARMMLVGHQPAWSILVSVLTGERLEMRTATVAVVTFDIDRWKELPSARGEITAAHRARDYFETEFDVE